MTNILAYLFRSINSKLITIDSSFLEKLLKVSLFFSLLLYRKLPKPNRRTPVLINNFDSSIRMMIDRSRSMGSAIFWTGFHEFREFLFLHRYLKSDMVFVDIGANQGEYALFAAKRLTAGKVVAFEPLPSMLKLLYENIKLNRFENIQVFEKGLSDKEQTLVIHEVEDAHEGLATIFLGDRVSKKSFSIQLARLDDLFAQTGLGKLDFIKIDIEGAELSALRGSEGLIRKYNPTVMVEINEKTFAAAGYKIQDVLDFFDQLGYTSYSIGKGGKLEACKQLPVFANIVFRPK